MKNINWDQHINEMASGYKNSAILLNALRAGIFESLGEDWKTVAEVADGCQLDHRATGIVLHALVAADILLQDAERFCTEPEARPLLLEGSPKTLKSILGHNLFMMRGWAHLDEVLQTGQPIRREERNEAQMRDFICGMENVSRISSQEVAAKIDLGSAQKLLDLGGGPATASITFAQAFPRLQCEVFDLEGPVNIGREQIVQAGLSHRITTVDGDFHTDDIGSGFDVVYLANIIHMMNEKHTLSLLQKSFKALVPGGRLLLKDFFLEDSCSEPAFGAQFSVNMLVNTQGGKTYTRSEVFELLKQAGFTDFEVVDVGLHSQVIICLTPSGE